MKLLVIDFDGTLADTRTFKTKMFEELEKICGISVEMLNNIYNELWQGYGIQDWTPFYTKLSEQSGISVDILEKSIQTSMKHLHFIPLTEKFVREFRGYKILLSYGDKEFQKKKIELSEANLLFDKVILTDDSKINVLKGLASLNSLVIDGEEYEDIILIDDNKKFLQEVREQLPFIKVIDIEELSLN
ncbi:MAG TPA: hypothetical protein VK338_00200 [Candidatus Nitrosocosmicus sp.]|nr:hypothetical protein [Candidatus Nitrosocosmicus sp.]